MIIQNKVKLKDKNYSVKFIPEDSDDLWQLYKIINKGDRVESLTHRNIKKGNSSEIKKTKNKLEKIVVKLQLVVETIDYISSQYSLRLSGKTVEQHEFVPQNSYHTFDVELKRYILVIKERWDNYDLMLLKNISSFENKVELGAVTLEQGIAHLLLISENTTVLKAKIQKSIPKSNNINSGKNIQKAMSSFYTSILSAILTHFNFDKLKVILFASPGFYAESLHEKLLEICNSKSLTSFDDEVYQNVLKNKFKIIVAHSSNGFPHSLKDLLQIEKIQKKIGDTKYMKHENILKKFSKALNDNYGKALYGESEVTHAISMNAVESLMISDSLFKNDNVDVRMHYVNLVNEVKRQNSNCFIFSSLHETGIQLNNLSGIAALLKYPLNDLYESEN